MAKYYSRSRLERVAEAVSDLRYSEMQRLSAILADMASERDEFTGVKAEALANLLSDWAQAVEEEIAEKETEQD